MERNWCCSAAIKRKNGHKSRGSGGISANSCCKDDCLKMFRVLVDPPSAGTFFSGSEVRGRVIVETEEEKTCKYIHVSLTGRAQVSSEYVHSSTDYSIQLNMDLHNMLCGLWQMILCTRHP